MSDPKDPKKPIPPKHPDPNAEGAKPDEAKPESPGRAHTGGSSFEFQLPEDVGSYSDLPPVRKPDATDPDIGHQGALPPRPESTRPVGATGSFDFIDLPPVDPALLSGSPLPAGLVPAPFAPPLLTPTDAVISLPPVAGDSSVAYSMPVRPADPSSGTLHVEALDVGAFPEVPPADPASGIGSVPDVTTLFPSSDPLSSFDLGQVVPDAPAAPDSVGSFVLPAPPPMAFPDPSSPSTPDIATLLPPTEIPTVEPGSFASGAPAFADLDLPAAHDSHVALGNLEPVDPVAPASGWLDSDVLSIPTADPGALIPTAEPAAGPFDSIPHAPESSDIFSGARAAAALPVEQSDVIAATAYGTASAADSGRPAEPQRPSEVALTFDRPPGGSTDHDGMSDELLVADEFSDSDAELGTPSDSIHDMPYPASADPLFDSARLADAPNLPPPPSPANDDTTDYGSAPAYTADASSILADLSEPSGPPGGDSSSVRVESPGVDRTLTGEPADGAFDLTVADDPIPANLFEEPSEGTAVEPTDWTSQSGSDLFAEGRAALEIDFASETETVEPVDADLTSDQPSLSSAPSSIFTGGRVPGSGSAGSGGSDKVRIGASEPPGDLADADLAEAELADPDEAEFTDHPALNETVERAKDQLPVVPAKPVHKASSADFELPATPAAANEDGGAIDWDAAALAEGAEATRGIPRDASLSGILRSLDDDSAESPTRGAKPLAKIDNDDEGGPVVTVDWLASSAEGTAVTEAQAGKTSPTKPKEKEKAGDRGQRKAAIRDPDADSGSDEVPKSKPSRGKTAPRADDSGEYAKDKPAKKGGGLLVGLLLGGIVVGGASAAAYFGGLVPNSEKTAQVPPKPDDGGNPPPGDQGTQPPAHPQPSVAANPRETFIAGGTASALEMLKNKPAGTPDEKAEAGFVRVFAKVQELGKTNTATAAADDPDLKQAREDLKAVANDAEAAKMPEGEKRAVAATVRLGISYEIAGDKAEARKVYAQALTKFPKHTAVFASLLERLDADEKAPGTSLLTAPRLAPEDAQRVLFAVTLLLTEEPAKTEDDPEPGLYYWKAVNRAAAGKYADAIDLIGKAKAAHLKRAKALAGRGLNPLTDPLEQMFARSCDELTAYWKLRGELYSNPAIADAIKKNGVAKTLDSLAKAEKDLSKVEKDLATAKADVAKTEKEVMAAKEEIAKLDKEAKKAAADKLAVERSLDKAMTDLKAKQKETDDLLAALAAELKPAKVLPEKWTPADLVAGVKATAALASGVDAQRVVKAETAAKAAEVAAKAAEVAAKAATDKLAVETKKLTDTYAADLKKLKDDSAAAIKTLKDENAAERKKLADASAADIKKLTDEHEIALKKLKDASAAALKEEQARTEAERKALAVQKITFEKQLANAVTPAQAMDLWLSILTDLRRPTDAPPALATATRALASSVPGSEEEAKAHTVKGMAFLLKNDLAGAKDEFYAARKSPAYAAAKGKAWARAADAGMDAIDDPLAPYRQPVVVPPVDLKAAIKALDVGISAYKVGKFDVAATALAEAARSDPSDPLAWYYLGAARWERGDTKQAEKDFGQGAEREKTSPLPGRVVSEALSPIQGAVRDAIDKARP